MTIMFDKDPLTALEAFGAAQWLAFAPLAFQATLAMRKQGVLAALAGADQSSGLSTEEVAQTTGLSVYATRVLLEAGLGLRIIWRTETRYHLGKLGWLLLNDEMTAVNFNFAQDVCYRAAEHLEMSLTENYPAGLQELGPWATIYEGLSSLPEPALSSWHAFDQFYSSQAFETAIETFVKRPPSRLLDVGCNTGKWAALFLSRIPSAIVGLLDLAPQLAKARTRIEQAGFIGRAQFHEIDILKTESALPLGYDVIWMSQFLDCFSEEQIVSILGRAAESLMPGGSIYILELFWDRQRFEAAAFSLQMTSLYFSCVANGNSQMYESVIFIDLIKRAGLRIEEITDGVGGYHTLLRCVPT